MKKIIIVLLSILCIFGFSLKIESSEATTYTVTLDAKGQFVRTQDAYLPDYTDIDMGLEKPEDMMFDEDGYLWIADTGHKRIVKYDTYQHTVMDILTHPDFVSPKGVFISSLGIYVADSGAKKVFRFDLNKNLVQTFVRPTSPSFSDTAFEPNKLVVDNRGNIYIHGEGVSSGIIQLSNTGEFLGFFTTNQVKLSLTQQFYKLILSQDQFDRLALRSPATFSSLFIDKNSMIYTSTMSTKTNAIKKHNVQGGNMFKETVSGDDTRDIYVDDQGIVFAGTQTGAIYVYDATGEFIFSFGVRKNTGPRQTEDIKGLFSSLSAIAIREDGYVFALDESKSFLQSFRPTDYAKQIYLAIDLYEQRAYEEAILAWQEVLNLNQMSTLAHNSIAKSYLQLENYGLATHHFELAGNRTLYSQSYWEIRNIAIQNALGIVIIAIVLLYALSRTLVFIDQKTGKISSITQPVKQVFKIKMIVDIFYFLRVIRHPLDSFYELKKGRQGTVLSATIIYVLTFIAFIIYSSQKGFIFQTVLVEDLDLSALILGFFLVTGLFMISNYLDTSLHDGIGNFKQIYIMFTYALGPLLISLLSVTVLTHFLTLSEVFFINAFMYVGIIYTVILIFLGIVETHQYTGKKAFKSILMSLLFSLIIIVVLIIMITMWRQLYVFFDGIVRELIRNVAR